jgi:hypothetical protein
MASVDPAEKVQELVASAAPLSPVFNTITRAVPVTVRLEK